MAKLVLFNKPFQVMSQFSAIDNKQTLADFIDIKDVYPAGRLDYDSEGLLLLTDNGPLQHQISHPDHKEKKTYWVQVDGQIDQQTLNKLSSGVELKDGPTLPAQAIAMEPPENLWPRVPPIRERQNQPTSWLSLTISEGRNRQVRRMTAAVGFPTLRLIRYSIGDWNIDQLALGEQQSLEVEAPKASARKSRTKYPAKTFARGHKPSPKSSRSSNTRKPAAENSKGQYKKRHK